MWKSIFTIEQYPCRFKKKMAEKAVAIGYGVTSVGKKTSRILSYPGLPNQ
jgi:hypothetical protein